MSNETFFFFHCFYGSDTFLLTDVVEIGPGESMHKVCLFDMFIYVRYFYISGDILVRSFSCRPGFLLTSETCSSKVSLQSYLIPKSSSHSLLTLKKFLISNQ